jgi:quercetin dioxygenase-like cupin family protein
MQITKSSLTTVASSQERPEWFTGEVYIDRIASPSGRTGVLASSVHLAPGARSAWHKHPKGQVIYIVEGVGFVQLRGEAAEVVRPGDSIFFEPGEDNWHGAAPDRFCTHLALVEWDENTPNQILGEHVTDEEYEAATAGVAH